MMNIKRLIQAGNMCSLLTLVISGVSIFSTGCNNAAKPGGKLQPAKAAADARVTHADADQPSAPTGLKQLMEDFIPKGWKVIASTTGDLNRDGINDGAIVIEDTNPDNFKRQNGMGPDTLNLNPRTLMVFLKHEDGYQLISQNDKGFVPPAHNEESPCLADPLLQDGDISIQKGLLVIGYQYWLSCGSWFVNNAVYKFRYQHKALEMIGFDHTEFHRSSGETTSTSINYVTKKQSMTTGENMFDDKNSQPKTSWSSIQIRRLYRLEDCNESTYAEILGI